MKKYLCLILLAVMFLSIFATMAMADSPNFRVSEAEANPGDEVVLTISMENNPGIASFDLQVDYDENKLEWVDVHKGSFSGMWDTAVGQTITWFNSENNYDNTVIAELTFKVKENASEKAEVLISYEEGDVYNIDEEDVDFEIIAGGINIKGKEAEEYKITIINDIGGTASVSAEAAKEGEIITVAAIPDEDYETESITYTPDGESSAEITEGNAFIMPDKNVTIEVRFKKKLVIIVYWNGDVNDDSKVDAKDKAVLNRYLAGWKDYDQLIMNWDAADINRDDKINAKDKAVLNRYLAGWDVYEKFFEKPVQIQQK